MRELTRGPMLTTSFTAFTERVVKPDSSAAWTANADTETSTE